MAQQRALRLLLTYEGWSPEEVATMAHRMDPAKVKLSDPTLQFMLPAMAAMWLDGLATCMRAIRQSVVTRRSHRTTLG